MPGLIYALNNDKAAYWACLVLREIGPAAKDAVPALVEKLKDPRPEIRREVILTLAAMEEAAEPGRAAIAAALTTKILPWRPPTRWAASDRFPKSGHKTTITEGERQVRRDPKHRQKECQERRQDAQHREPLGVGPRSS